MQQSFFGHQICLTVLFFFFILVWNNFSTMILQGQLIGNMQRHKSLLTLSSNIKTGNPDHHHQRSFEKRYMARVSRRSHLDFFIFSFPYYVSPQYDRNKSRNRMHCCVFTKKPKIPQFQNEYVWGNYCQDQALKSQLLWGFFTNLIPTGALKNI